MHPISSYLSSLRFTGALFEANTDFDYSFLLFGFILVADVAQLGAKESLEALTLPLWSYASENSNGSWELALPSEIDTGLGLSSSSTASSKLPRNLQSSDGTPLPSMKYLIQTPPRATLASRSASPSLGSLGLTPTHLQPQIESISMLVDIHEWPSLEDFFVTVPEWANCSICSDLFDEPVLWPNCDHVFCKSCVVRLLNYGHRECPMCRSMLPNDVGFGDLKHSVQMSSALLLLPVRCRWGLTKLSHSTSSNNGRKSPASTASSSQLSFGVSCETLDSGPSSLSSMDAYLHQIHESRWMVRADEHACSEIVPLSSLQDHLRTCSFAPTRCLNSGCHGLFKRSEIAAHQLECPHRPVECRSCLRKVSHLALPSHQLTCPEVSIKCNCGFVIPRKLLASHLETDCPNVELECQWSRHGCSYSGQRSALDEHIKTCPYEAVKGYIAKTEARFADYDRNIERLESMILALRAQVHSVTTRSNSRTLQNSARIGNDREGDYRGENSSGGTSSRNSNPLGSVGHGRRSGRFWDDYDNFDLSDDEFSIHL